MPAKAGGKKAAKSDDEPKKKDSTKGSKKNNEDVGEVGSATTGQTSSSKTPAGNQVRGTSQLGTPTDESSNKEPGASTIEPGQQTEGNREGGEAGDNAASVPVPEVDIKYEEPILPNLIVLKYEYSEYRHKPLSSSFLSILVMKVEKKKVCTKDVERQRMLVVILIQ